MDSFNVWNTNSLQMALVAGIDPPVRAPFGPRAHHTYTCVQWRIAPDQAFICIHILRSCLSSFLFRTRVWCMHPIFKHEAASQRAMAQPHPSYWNQRRRLEQREFLAFLFYVSLLFACLGTCRVRRIKIVCRVGRSLGPGIRVIFSMLMPARVRFLEESLTGSQLGRI